ncbi:PREDICTED: uncharacterized protein LOC108553873 [Eufriesea mexicana]|uniref:uncharacterized protein LOC108553873 n=1 Tax=Eufriesea mexicana TaxID=516756 RepID=UPI00083C1EFA|nr:PREDICTED: uncharacterized protein LOC108553873 [Eufriesea mexicana]
MDRTNSRGSNSSTIGKHLEKPPPFKLCFPKDRLLGKSYIRLPKINDNTITPKFYSKGYTDTIDMHEENTKQQENTCNSRALVTSHAYGWWHRQGLQPIKSQFNFHKQTSGLANFGVDVRNTAA